MSSAPEIWQDDVSGSFHREGAQRPLTILVADDDTSNLLLLKRLLQREGHQAIPARDGKEAVALFEHHQPDMVLMDIMMPVMNGYDATRKIKALTKGRFVPVMFITALTDEAALAECVACGGDDFLSKPYNPTIIRAKIDALERVRQLYGALKVQKDELAQHHTRLQIEHELAERLFANIADPRRIDASNIRHRLSPKAITSGDMLLVAHKPSGAQHIMLGDFTGHGLAAAVGAIPVSDVFHTMTARGRSLQEIAAELNRKLYYRLPTGFFLAACLIEFDPSRRSATVWNGGVPDVLIYGESKGIHSRIASRHLPLGVVNEDMFDPQVDVLSVTPEDHIFVYSDGIIEADDPGGNAFGQARLEQCIEQATDPADPLGTVFDALYDFRKDTDQSDDITMLEVLCDPERFALQTDRGNPVSIHPGHWKLSLHLDPESLKFVDPLQVLMQSISTMQPLAGHTSRVYTILAELFNNSLDYGLLGLDPGKKKIPEGFADYYAERQQALAALSEGAIDISVEHAADENGGRLLFHIQDTGPGFDHERALTGSTDTAACGGRGLKLVTSLCDKLVYHDKGNHVEAVYTWH